MKRCARYKRLLDGRFNICAQALLLGTWHRLLIFFELSWTKSLWSDWSTRWSLTNLIGWLFSDVTGDEAFLGFLGQPKLDKNHFGRPSFRPIFVQFWSGGKKQCLSQAVYIMISTGYPDLWKLANVTPIFKKEDKQLVKNYRPISLLPICGKIFEKLVFDTLYAYLRDRGGW